MCIFSGNTSSTSNLWRTINIIQDIQQPDWYTYFKVFTKYRMCSDIYIYLANRILSWSFNKNKYGGKSYSGCTDCNQRHQMLLRKWINGVSRLAAITRDTILGLSSLRHLTARSRSLKASAFRLRLSQSLWNLTDTSAAALPRCLSNLRAIRLF